MPPDRSAPLCRRSVFSWAHPDCEESIAGVHELHRKAANPATIYARRISPPRLMLRHTLDYGAFDVTLWRVYCWVGERWKPTDADARFLELMPNWRPDFQAAEDAVR